MKKSLQILLGLVLILVLAYVAFLDVSTKIKDDLLTKTKVMFSENNVKHVTTNMQGEGLSLSRTLVLTGTAISDVERVRIVTLTENIEGVCSIDNQIKLHPVVPKAPKVPLAPNIPTVVKVPVVKTSTEPVIAKSIPKEVLVIKSTEKKDIVEPVVEEKEPTSLVSATSNTVKIPLVPVLENTISVSSTKVPTVPTVKNNSIVVPVPVTAINAPNVIKIEKIKLEGVK